MDGLRQENSIYLNLSIRKGGETDPDGNYIFEVEASNESLDLQGQIVLQSALLESKDYFLNNGVISFDHLHKRRGADGTVISDPAMIIGEPIEVRTDGKKTIVKGKLYPTKETALEIIKMLKANSTRIKASVGGIWPQIVKDAKTGAEKIAHVLWNDLALTVSPVNSTVSSAYLARSMEADEFVKTLTAGAGMDHADFTGGRAMIPENTETYVTENSAGYEEQKDKILSLLAAIKTNEIQGEQEAIKFLVHQGLDIDKARATVREISLQGGQIMKFADQVQSFVKSLTSGEPKTGKPKDKDKDDEELDLDTKDQEGAGEGGGEGEEGEGSEGEGEGEGKDMNKGLVDATEILSNLVTELKDMNKSLKTIIAGQDDVGGAIVGVAEMVNRIANTPLPAKSAIAKGGLGNGAPGAGGGAFPRAVQPIEVPTQVEFERAQDILIKSFKAGEITLQKSESISSDLQKAMRIPGHKMNPEYYNFLVSKMRTA